MTVGVAETTVIETVTGMIVEAEVEVDDPSSAMSVANAATLPEIVETSAVLVEIVSTETVTVVDMTAEVAIDVTHEAIPEEIPEAIPAVTQGATQDVNETVVHQLTKDRAPVHQSDVLADRQRAEIVGHQRVEIADHHGEETVGHQRVEIADHHGEETADHQRVEQAQWLHPPPALQPPNHPMGARVEHQMIVPVDRQVTEETVLMDTTMDTPMARRWRTVTTNNFSFFFKGTFLVKFFHFC